MLACMCCYVSLFLLEEESWQLPSLQAYMSLYTVMLRLLLHAIMLRNQVQLRAFARAAAAAAARAPGSIGGRTDPGKVWKGKKMPGHLGCERVTFKNIWVYKVSCTTYNTGELHKHKT
jgi:hypothetical protein